MIKFLDQAGLTALWNKIKSTFYTKTQVNTIVDKKVDDYSRMYLTFEAIESGTFSFSRNALQYSIDNGSTWTTLSAGTSTPTISAGNTIMWKQTGLTPSNSGIGIFSATGNFNAYGNVMSLYYGDNFINQTNLTGKNNAFKNLFNNNVKVIDTLNLILPAIILTEECYSSMFWHCSSLITSPKKLPAVTLTRVCYQAMFSGCTSLVNVPELPATTLYSGCYMEMFSGCTSLIKAPELPATTLISQCYQSMFNGCTSLSYIKCLATDISATNCITNWVQNVAATGTFIMNIQAQAGWTYGNSGIPSGWSYYFEHSQEYIYEIQRRGNALTLYKKSYKGLTSNTFALFSNVAFSNNYNDLNNKPIIPDPLINITSNGVNSKVEKFNGETVKEKIIPINTTSNAYDESDDGTTSTTEIVPYINSSVNDNYLVLKLGGVLKNYNIIIDSSLIGSNFNCHPSILYNNGYLAIYPTLPMNLILNQMQYLYVKYYTKQTSTNVNLYLWFDDFADGYYDTQSLNSWTINESDTSANSWQDYVENYLLTSTYRYRNANGYKYTGETFDWGGTDYYLWKGFTQMNNSVKYIVTSTIDYNVLYNNSLEANYLNHWCPYISKFDGDYQGERYDAEGSHDILVAVSNDPLVRQTLWATNKGWDTWEDYMNDYIPNIMDSAHYANEYEYYGDTFEWEGEEYYIWEHSDADYYILTDTIDYQTLYSKSIEADYANAICPYVAMLDADKELVYEASERQDDWLIKVDENSNVPGQARYLYIDDFPTN